jgi:hypothetical protein
LIYAALRRRFRQHSGSGHFSGRSPLSHVALFPELAVNPLLNSVGGHAHEAGLGLASGGGFADLKTPFPQSRLNLHKGKFNAPAVHDFGRRRSSFAFSPASSFERTSRSASPWRRRVKFLPMTSTATPVSAAAAKQQHQDNDDKDQFHKKSPLR